MSGSGRKTIAVLGGGSAGLTAATTASREGARVILFLGPAPDRASLCVNAGCMPSKALFGPIDTLYRARRYVGCSTGTIDPNAFLESIVRWKDREIARFRAYRQRAIRAKASDDFVIVRAPATFVDRHTLQADGETFTVDAVIIATGSRVTIPGIEGLDEIADDIWTNEEILANRTLPASLVVVGAGPIGLEFALRYARLGSTVTIVTRGSILSRYPDAFGQRLREIFEHEGIRVLTERKIHRIHRDIEGWIVCETEGSEGHEPIVAERLLLSAGRRPNVDRLNLEAVGIDPSGPWPLQRGDDMRVSGFDDLFVAGDAGARRMVVHHAHIEAGIAAENAVGDGEEVWRKRSNLQIVFTDPEFAYAGETPAEAEAAGKAFVTSSRESRLVGKLHLAGDDRGFGSFIADSGDHRLLGAGLLCDEASELIHLPAYLIDHQHTVHDAGHTEVYHPTRIEIVGSLLDDLCHQLEDTPFCRAPE